MKFLIFLIAIPSLLFSQEINYAASTIPTDLKDNANAVVRLNQIDITIASQRRMTIKQKRILTVLNEYGVSSIDALEYYDKNRRIIKIQAHVFDAFGKEIKTIRRNDFKDVSVGDGFSVFTDNRMLYLDYTPINYPFTVVYESEIETSNTAFIPTWLPVDQYFLSAEKSVITVTSLPDLGFKYKEVNFSPKYEIKKEQAGNKVTFTGAHLKALKYEELSPSFFKIFPTVMMGLNVFHLEGIDGSAKDWKEMGLWFSNTILTGTSELPEITILKIKELVGAETDPVKKAKIVYDFVQQKTRYVSIQEGIGGWRPMLAKDVDRLGYGDCKALTNYTKSLLDAVGVPSYYTRLYGDRAIKSIVPDFVSMQSNHVILAVPTVAKMYWLECTSQTTPFGFQGTFTDHRNVLILKPTGGEIVATPQYSPEDNSQETHAKYKIDDAGKISGTMTITSSGTQYEKKYLNKDKSATDVTRFYKSYFDNINNLKVNKVTFADNKEAIKFTENIEIEAEKYADANNNKLMFVVNAFNVSSDTPKRYRSRENPFEISRGFYDQDEVEIILPENYTIEAMPENVEIKNKYGTYHIEFILKSDKILQYKRSLVIKEGFYESTEYDVYRLFREQIAKNDNAKIILTKKS